jgi:hypothetical protein
MDFDHRGRKGPRIILLGDGSHLSTTPGESEFFDQDDEDDDLENQLSRNPESPVAHEGKQEEGVEAARAQREDTPGPVETSAQTVTPSSGKPEVVEKDDQTPSAKPESQPTEGDQAQASATEPAKPATETTPATS